MQTFYGDSTRWFIGIVTNNNDHELKLGRVQVRIYGIHDNTVDIAYKDLPWAQVLVPSTEDGTSGLGLSPNLKNGAQVFGIFLDGKQSQAPLILGSIPKIEIPTITNIDKAVRDSKVNDKTLDISKEPIEKIETQQNIVKQEGSTNAEIAYNFFIANSLSSYASAGIVGCLITKAGADLNPTQFTRKNVVYPISRLSRYNKFSREHNLDANTLNAVLQFIIYEGNKYPGLGFQQTVESTDINKIATNFGKRYLLINNTNKLKECINNAKDVYERFSG